MNRNENTAGDFEHQMDGDLDQALSLFRKNVHAWADGEMSRPRAIAQPNRGIHHWRPAAAWSLGCALIAGMASGTIYQQHRLTVASQIRVQQEAEHQKQLAAQKAKEEEDLLAKVDSDISREVPSAMEPLAQLMAEDESK